MTTRRNALGRGLDALIPGSGPALAPLEPRPGADSGASELPIDLIDPNPEQPRRHFDPDEIARLAESIRRHGVLQPVVVRRVGSRYELVVGERRWRAGKSSLPAVVADVDSPDRLELALVENVQRRDLNPIELAQAFRSLAEAGATQEEIGERVGLDRSTIANHLRLLDLGRELQEDVEQGRLGVGHAKALLGVANPERRRHLRDRIVRDGLPVRAAEELARRSGGPGPERKPRPRAAVDPELRRLVDSLRRRFQTQVRVQGDAGRGRIEIEYFGAEDLQRIAGILLGDA
jgi:ParB family chromosome partitioning protein